MIVLGDTKIRKDPALVQNFGLASAGGVQDKEEVAMVARLNREREALYGRSHVDVVGTGSILSDKNWSPLLNDSLMLGGMHTGQEFVFAEDRANTVPTAAAGTPQEWWNTVFLTFPDILWGDWGAPRVYARELLGLKTFEYTPVFSYHQVTYTPGNNTSGTFSQYLAALKGVGFEDPKTNKQRIIRAISEWLFGDPMALDGMV